MSSDKTTIPTDFHTLGYDAFSKGISDLITHFIESQNAKTKKTFKSLLFGLCILLGVDCFKTVLQNFIKEQQKIINESLMTAMKSVSVVDFLQNLYSVFVNSFYGFIDYIRNIISTIFNKKQLEIKCDEESVVDYVPENFVTINFKPNAVFCESLVNYIKNDKTAKYDEEYETEIVIGENDSIDIGLNYRNVEIFYEGVKMEMGCLNKKGEFLENKEIFSETNIEEFMKTIKFNDYDCDLQINYSKVSCSIWVNHIEFKINNSLFPIVNSKFDASFTMILCLMLGKKNYLDFTSHVQNIGAKKLKLYLNACDVLCNLFGKFGFNRHIEKLYLELTGNTHKFTYLSDTIYFYISGKAPIVESFETFPKTKLYKLLQQDKVQSTTTTIPVSTTLPITLSSPTLSTKQLYSTFTSFIEHVKKSSKLFKSNTEVKIFTITVKTNTLTTNQPNPDYTTYQEKKEKTKQFIQAKNPDITEKELQKELLTEIGMEPDKTIPTNKIEKTIETNETNKTYHSFDNLYLHKGQDKELYDICYKFKHEKATRKRLGLRNKLVICLHGEAGTGKSTTIATLGSLLGRDIFYVNIKGYKNEDVKMIFDHINKIHQGGGIIAFEDFDAQSDVVKSTTIASTSIHGLMETKGDNLTLDFLLNLFDGTLTYDDSIIVITTNYPELFCKEMIRDGRVDRMIEMKRCDHYQIRKMYKNFMEREIDNAVLLKIKENAFIPAEIIARLALCYGKTELSDEDVMEKFCTK